MEANADAGMAREGVGHGQIRLLVRGFKDVSEVTDRLMIVNGQRENDATRHRRR
jgi:hypothetical protein